MSRFLQQLSGFCFYVLGSALFLSYVLLRNGIGGNSPAIALQLLFLPFAGSAITYGGVSFFRSLRLSGTSAKVTGSVIGVLLGGAFAGMVVFSFSPLMG